jgi:hypothetical protein
MRLAEALPVFKGLELKMSEAYLWCSINFGDYELRKFFSEMTDAELGHARTLDALLARPESIRAVIELPPGMVDTIRSGLEEKVRALQMERDVHRAFSLIAEMEQSELNAVFDSIVRGLAELNLAHLELTTRQHIASVREAADRLGIAFEARAALDGLMVKDRSYYRLFTD